MATTETKKKKNKKNKKKKKKEEESDEVAPAGSQVDQDEEFEQEMVRFKQNLAKIFSEKKRKMVPNIDQAWIK